MNGRDAMQAALSTSGTAVFPVVICYDEIFIRDHWEALTSRPWWHGFAPGLEEQKGWIRDVFDAVPMDWFTVRPIGPRARRQSQTVEEYSDHVVIRDPTDGSTYPLKRPGIAEQGHYEEAIAAGFSESKAPFPETSQALEAAVPWIPDADIALAEGELDLQQWIEQGPGQGRLPYAAVSAPLWHCFARWQFEDTMTRCLTDADLVRLACERHMSACAHTISRAAALGAEALWIEECMTDMLSPRLFADLSLPWLREIVRQIHKAGMKSILYYCGNPMDRLDLLLETGADALALEESKKGFCIDITEIATRINGRCALFGNLDSIGVLQDASEPTLRREVARQLRAGEANQGRFVMSLGSPVTPGTSVERVRRYCELVRELQG